MGKSVELKKGYVAFVGSATQNENIIAQDGRDQERARVHRLQIQVTMLRVWWICMRDIGFDVHGHFSEVYQSYLRFVRGNTLNNLGWCMWRRRTRGNMFRDGTGV